MQEMKEQNSPDVTCLAELPLAEFNKKKYAIYIIDYNWNYLFANDYAKNLLGNVSIVGKNVTQIWAEMPEVNFQPSYNLLKDSVAAKTAITRKLTSPLTNKSIEIKGTPLPSCYLFSVVELPDKESLISELKNYLKRAGI